MKFAGWPSFDRNWKYLGPIPGRCGHNHLHKLIGHNTSPAAAYPPGMCKWIADEVLQDMLTPPPVFLRRGAGKFSTPGAAAGGLSEFREGDCIQVLGPGLVVTSGTATPTDYPRASTPSNDSSDEDMPMLQAVDDSQVSGEDPPDLTSDEEEPGVPKPRIEAFPGGLGQPLTAHWSGKAREFHDGAGLCSPGRFLPSRRKQFRQPALVVLRGGLRNLMHKAVGKLSSEADLKALCTTEEGHARLDAAADSMRTF
jgi:hypothetical protein